MTRRMVETLIEIGERSFGAEVVAPLDLIVEATVNRRSQIEQAGKLALSKGRTISSPPRVSREGESFAAPLMYGPEGLRQGVGCSCQFQNYGRCSRRWSRTQCQVFQFHLLHGGLLSLPP